MEGNVDEPKQNQANANEHLLYLQQRLARIPPFSPNMSEDDFFRCLSTFLSIFGFPLHRYPSVQGKPVPLKYLLMIVLSQGGFEKVEYSRLWPLIDNKLGFPSAPSTAMSVSRTHYYGLLWVYEQIYVQRRPINQLSYPVNWNRSAQRPPPDMQQQYPASSMLASPHMANQQPTVSIQTAPTPPQVSTPQTQATPNLHLHQQASSPTTSTKPKEKTIFWQQLATATKPLRVPTAFGDLGTVSLKNLYQAITCGCPVQEARALNTLQCIVHPGIVKEKDVSISIPPNAPFLVDIVGLLMDEHGAVWSSMPKFTLSKLKLQLLNQKHNISNQPAKHNHSAAKLEIVESILRGMACGDGRSSLVLFDPLIKPPLFRMLVESIEKPVNLSSFANCVVILSRLCSGAGQVQAEDLIVLLTVLEEELDAIGPLLCEMASHPRFGMTICQQQSDDPDGITKSINSVKERMLFLAHGIPGHVYLLMYSLSLLFCNTEQNKINTREDLHERVGRVIESLFTNIIRPMLPTLCAYMHHLRLMFSMSSKRQSAELLQASLPDAGYVELSLFLCQHAFVVFPKLVIHKMDTVVPSILHILEACQYAYSRLNTVNTLSKGLKFDDSCLLEAANSHPVNVWTRGLDVLRRFTSHGHGQSSNSDTGNLSDARLSLKHVLINTGWFDRLFEWSVPDDHGREDFLNKQGLLDLIHVCFE